MSNLKSIYRTYTCAELRAAHAGQDIFLSGWVHRKRDHGGVIFVDLRDNYGLTQIVFGSDVQKEISHLKAESVIKITGTVLKRAPELVNSKLNTGEIEVAVSGIEVLSEAAIVPFQINEDDGAPEATRLTYRFLELRRDKLHRNIQLRSDVIRGIREIMWGMDFREFQTPILTSSSPEGARDFIVPSRVHPGKFFALPQAPQQFKQLLMVSGFDRYFQIAPCFRDEDARADRSPGEFYQVDIECSFVEQEDVFAIGEKLFVDLFNRFTKLPTTAAPFPRIRYEDSLLKYGNDKPDLRNSLEIADVSDVFAATEFRVFKSVLDSKGALRAIAIKDAPSKSRSYFDDTIEFFKKMTGQGLAYLVLENGEAKGTVAKFVSASEVAALKIKLGLENGVIFLAAGAPKVIVPALGKLRTKLGEDYGRIDKDAFKFCWVVDFKMFEHDGETGELVFSHNPFSMPQGGLEALRSKNPLDIYAYQYDIVCNGYELSSGAIRNHKPEIMYEAFKIVGYTKEQVDAQFGGMIRAFNYGAPPHGGFAPGVDRIVMLLAGEEAIREVIAFPLTQNAEDLLMGAPSVISEKALREAHIAIRLPEVKPKISEPAPQKI